jgi:hypothetical protein
MSDLLTQQQRKAENIRDASVLVESAKPDAERLLLANAELLLADEDRMAALLYEVCEMVVRLERAADHLNDHVVSAQGKEIESLKKRVAALEPSRAASAAPKEK